MALFFTPLERALRNHLLPALIGGDCGNINADFRELLGYSVKGGRIGIQNPVDMAPFVFGASNKATNHLVDSLIDDAVHFKLRLHHCLVDPEQRQPESNGSKPSLSNAEGTTMQ